MRRIYFVRHGENLSNLTKEFSYKHVDYSLTEKGRLQAQQTATFFTDQGITRIYSSPLKRAYETAEIIGSRLQLPVQILESFREINVGRLEGQPVTTALWEEHNRVIAAWQQGDIQCAFPDGENYTDILTRMKRGFNEIRSPDNDTPVLIVGHGGILTTTIHELCSNVKKGEMARVGSQNCSITLIERSGSQMWLKYWGRSDHLSGDAAELISGVLQTEK